MTVFERESRIGGLLRYGIPDFKMEKHLIDRRVEQMEAEGVTFRTHTAVGVDISADEISDQFDAVMIAAGSTAPRDLDVPGRELKGVHFAMDFLPQQNKVVAGERGSRADHGPRTSMSSSLVAVIPARIVWALRIAMGRPRSTNSSFCRSPPRVGGKAWRRGRIGR